MSEIFRCIDCGKDFRFFYPEINVDCESVDVDQYQQMIDDYTKGINFPKEINICFDCLQNIKTEENLSMDSNQNNNTDNSITQTISQINKKYSEDEKDLKKITEKDEIITPNELKELSKKVEKNESELISLLKELENIEKEETYFCNLFRDLEIKLNFAEKDLSKATGLKSDYQKKIKNLTKNNIFSGLFQISFNDKFGTINECKFCDPYISSNYDGINAGWGYIVLLTKLLSVKYGFESAKYILIPEGNFSKIKNKNGTLHEIGLSDINRTKDKFNNAMCAYLEYLKEFLDYLTKENKIDITKKNLCPNINGNLINDKSILIESKDNLENWYQAMKFLLTILKFLICQILSNENEFYKQIITK